MAEPKVKRSVRADYTGMGTGFIKENYKPNPSYIPGTKKKGSSYSGNKNVYPYVNRPTTLEEEIAKEEVNFPSKSYAESNPKEYQKEIIRETERLRKKYSNTKIAGKPKGFTDEELTYKAKGLVDQKYKPTKDKVKDLAINAGLAFAPELILGKGVPALTKLLKPGNPLLKGERVIGRLSNGTKVKELPHRPYDTDGFFVNSTRDRLPNPPAEVRIPGVGGIEEFSYDSAMRYAIQTHESYPSLDVMEGLQKRFPNVSRIELEQVYNRARNASPQFAATTNPSPGGVYKQTIRNQSQFTKEDLLQNPLLKDKDALSKLTESQFSNTVLKPNGEVSYYANPNSFKLKEKSNPYYGKNIIEDATPLSIEDYALKFNSNIDNLNKIIAKNNKSGMPYSVEELTPHGQLRFKPTNAEEEGVPFPTMGNRWSVNINPGEWKGSVKDIINKDYYQSIPGLEMSNTSGGVFSDGVARTGSGTYKSLNEYLKSLDLGRVKPGFNSQTKYSRAAWENAVSKGDAVGYYANPSTVYGVMKSLLPVAVGGSAVDYTIDKMNKKQKQEYALGGRVKYTGGGYALDPLSMSNLGNRFAQMNNLPQQNLLNSGLAGAPNVKTPGMSGAGLSAGIGAASELGGMAIDAFATPDGVNKANTRVEINEGAAAGKGALKGAAAGAAAGSVIPVIGTAVGAIGGALVGGISGYFGAAKKEDRMQNQLNDENNLLAYKKQQAIQSGYNATFPYGGMVPGNTDVELEKEEVFRTPDGQMGQVDGPSHAQGGVDMSLPAGTFVWSDKLKTASGRTFADEAAYLGKLKAKYEKILNS